MKERPILFSGPMVRAILDGRKTQSRRVVKPQPDDDGKVTVGEIGTSRGVAYIGNERSGGIVTRVPCRYGVPGDRLWVREMFCVGYEHEPGQFTAIPYSGCEQHRRAFYRATDDDAPDEPKRPWKPSIHMPRWASRITLEISDVRVQRLQDMTPDDIDAEGLDHYTVANVIADVERRYKLKPEHWIFGADEGLSFCRECALKEIARLKTDHPGEDFSLDGGWRTEGDSEAFCETCQHPLDNSFTNYGVRQQLEHFEAHPFHANDPACCHVLDTMLSAIPWDDDPHSSRLKRLAWRAVWDTINGKRAPWESAPWVWALSFRRVVDALTIAA